MFTVVIALTVLSSGSDGQIFKSKQTFPTEESCMEKLAVGLNELALKAKELFGPDGYLITGRCLQGIGDPA